MSDIKKYDTVRLNQNTNYSCKVKPYWKKGELVTVKSNILVCGNSCTKYYGVLVESGKRNGVVPIDCLDFVSSSN